MKVQTNCIPILDFTKLETSQNLDFEKQKIYSKEKLLKKYYKNREGLDLEIPEETLNILLQANTIFDLENPQQEDYWNFFYTYLKDNEHFFCNEDKENYWNVRYSFEMNQYLKGKRVLPNPTPNRLLQLFLEASQSLYVDISESQKIWKRCKTYVEQNWKILKEADQYQLLIGEYNLKL